MKQLRCVCSICAQNFRKWRTDYRVWCIGILLFVMTGIFADDIRILAEYMGTNMPVWIYPFMYTQFHTKLIFTLPVVLLFCNAPFTDRNQTFVFMRSGRIKWLCGQIMYIVFASAVYYLFLFVVSLLLTVFSGELSLEWGKTLTALGVSNSVGFEAGTPFVDIPYTVITFFKPLQAVWFTFLMSWLGAIFIGLTIFFFNLISQTRFLGVIVSSFFVLLSSAVANDYGWEGLLSFSPISWITLDKIDVGGLTKCPSFTYCISVFGIMIVSLSAAILIFGRKKSLDKRGEQ